jgi:hypothetical protein
VLVVARQPPLQHVQAVGLLNPSLDRGGNDPGGSGVARHDLNADAERATVVDQATLDGIHGQGTKGDQRGPKRPTP